MTVGNPTEQLRRLRAELLTEERRLEEQDLNIRVNALRRALWSLEVLYPGLGDDRGR